MAWARLANGHAELGDQLCGGVAFKAPAVEDEVGNVCPEAELFGELQLVLFTERGDVVLPVIDDLSADVGELAVHEPIAQREYATPYSVAGLQYDRLVAGRLQFGGGDQTRQPGADDQNFHAGSASIVSRACHKNGLGYSRHEGADAEPGRRGCAARPRPAHRRPGGRLPRPQLRPGRRRTSDFGDR